MQVRIRLGGGVARFLKPRLRAVFQPPLNVARTAVLVPGLAQTRFAQTRRVHVFPEGWSERAARFAPEIIAGRIHQLRDLARRQDRPPVSHALVVLRYGDDPPLTQDDRDRLWRVFGVPVFEQILNQWNQLLAVECGAHAGLHVVSGCAGLPLEAAPCLCGGSTPRLLPPEPKLLAARIAVA
jgi:hypothetical protein